MKKILVGLILFIVILLSILIQINLLNVVTFFGKAANIGIILIVGIGLMCDKEVGAYVGITYGFLQDILFGKSIGIYALLYMLLGYFSGKLGRGFSRENKTTMVVMTGFATLLFDIAFYILAGIFYKYDLEIFSSAFIILKEVIYNVLIAIIIFKPISLLAEIINKSKNSYYLL